MTSTKQKRRHERQHERRSKGGKSVEEPLQLRNWVDIIDPTPQAAVARKIEDEKRKSRQTLDRKLAVGAR